MRNVRKVIEEKYEKLQQLKKYESFLEYVGKDGYNHWWKIVTPDKEIYLMDEKTRQNFVKFIESEVIRIKTELEIEN